MDDRSPPLMRWFAAFIKLNAIIIACGYVGSVAIGLGSEEAVSDAIANGFSYSIVIWAIVWGAVIAATLYAFAYSPIMLLIQTLVSATVIPDRLELFADALCTDIKNNTVKFGDSFNAAGYKYPGPIRLERTWYVPFEDASGWGSHCSYEAGAYSVFPEPLFSEDIYPIPEFYVVFFSNQAETEGYVLNLNYDLRENFLRFFGLAAGGDRNLFSMEVSKLSGNYVYGN